MSAWVSMKKRFARRIWKFLHYWAVEADKNDMAKVIESYRRKGMQIGQRVVIYETLFDAVMPELVSIGDDVTITHATILTHDDSAVLQCGRRRAAPVRIGNRVFIGAKSIILPGVTVGDDCVVGAGSVVTRSIPPGSVVAGNPARAIRSIDEFKAAVTQRTDLIDYPISSNLVPAMENLAISRLAKEKYAEQLLQQL